MPGTTPTVETVTCRSPRPTALGSVSRCSAPNVLRSFASGSPIPMNTTLVSRRGVVEGSRGAERLPHRTWAAISPAVRLFCSPICPVAQNPHPIAHPDCVETQTVARSRYPMSTVSMTWRPPSRSRALRVAPRSASRSSSTSTSIGSSASRRSRRRLGTSGIRS